MSNDNVIQPEELLYLALECTERREYGPSLEQVPIDVLNDFVAGASWMREDKLPPAYFFDLIRPLLADTGFTVMYGAHLSGFAKLLILEPDEDTPPCTSPLSCVNQLIAGAGKLAMGEHERMTYQSMINALIGLQVMLGDTSFVELINTSPAVELALQQ